MTLTSALRALFSSLFCSWHILDVTKQLHLKQSIRRTLRIYTLSNTQARSYHLSNDLRPSWGLPRLSRWPYHPYELMYCDNSPVELEKWVTTMKVKPFLWALALPPPPALWTPNSVGQQCQNNGVKSPPTSVLSRGDKNQPVWLTALRVVAHFVKPSFLQNTSKNMKACFESLSHFKWISNWVYMTKSIVAPQNPWICGLLLWCCNITENKRVCFLTHAHSHRAVQLWFCSKTCKGTLQFQTSRNKINQFATVK